MTMKNELVADALWELVKAARPYQERVDNDNLSYWVKRADLVLGDDAPSDEDTAINILVGLTEATLSYARQSPSGNLAFYTNQAVELCREVAGYDPSNPG